MENLFEHNISSIGGYVNGIKQKKHVWKERLESLNHIYEKEQQLYIRKDNWDYRLNSVDSEKEVELMTKKIDFEKDNLLLVFGMSNYLLLETLVNKTSANSRILLFEPDLDILCYCLGHYQYQPIFDSMKIVLIDSDDFENQVMKELQVVTQLNWENLVYNMQVVMIPNYYSYKEFIVKCIKHVKELFDAKIKYLGNSLDDIFKGFRNTYKNVDEYMKCSNLNAIRNKFKGVPGIIVSAGPSLDKNIKYLQEAKDRALILACDASVRACENVGIIPDVVASIERVRETYQFYYEGRKFNEKTVLVAPTVLWPDIFKEYEGKKIVVSKMDKGYDEWFNSHFENINFENVGMSSATVAFKTALEAGCNPIILIGQDLAFTDDKIHSDSTHTEFEGENGTKLFDGNWVEGIDGKPVKTNDIYNWFRSWFEAMVSAYKDVKVIDATEGGAKIKGTEIACLKDVVQKYCTNQIDRFADYIENKEVTIEEKIEKYKELLQDTKKEIRLLYKIKKKAENYYQYLEKLYDKNIETMNEEQLIKTVKNMEKGNEIIEYIYGKQTLRTYFEQIIKQTITHVRLIGNELTAETVIKNLRLQGNLMGMIKRSCIVIIEEYENMSKFFQEKLEDKN